MGLNVRTFAGLFVLLVYLYGIVLANTLVIRIIKKRGFNIQRFIAMRIYCFPIVYPPTGLVYCTYDL